MDLRTTLAEFQHALNNQDKNKIRSILADKEWWGENDQEQRLVLENCETDIQLAYEFLTLLKLLEEFSTTYERHEKERISNLKMTLHAIVDNSNTDINLYDLSFLANTTNEKPKQGVLGQSKKEGKKYPNVPTSALIIMNPEFWYLDEMVPYLDSAKGEKKGLKINLDNGQLTIGQNKRIVDGEYLYVVSPKGGLYAMKEDRKRKHATIRAGQPVISAGHMTFTNGKITKIDSVSGHYTPPPKQTLLACLILKEQNMIDENCMIRLYGYKNKSLGAILQDPSMAKLVAECRQTLSEERVPNQAVINQLSRPKLEKKPTISQVKKEPVKTYPNNAGGRFLNQEQIEDYLNNEAVLKALGVPESVSIILPIKPLQVKSGGGKQSQRYRLKLSNGQSFFVKQLPERKNLTEQIKADNQVKEALGGAAQESSFVTMLHGDNIGHKNAIAIFPDIQASVLYNILQPSLNDYPASEEEKQSVIFQVGAALSTVQLQSLENQDQIEAFYENKGDLTGFKVLVHEDFQASNVMISKEGKVFFVDTEGAKLKNDPFFNLVESWVLMAQYDPKLMKAFISGYLSNFREDMQPQVLAVIQRELIAKYNKPHAPTPLPMDVFPTDLPIKVHNRPEDFSFLAQEQEQQEVKETAFVSRTLSKAKIIDQKTKHKSEASKTRVPVLSSSNKKRIKNQNNKLLYKLDDGKTFWKPFKGQNKKEVTQDEGQEVTGSKLANYITDGAVPRSEVRKFDGKMGFAQEYVSIDVFTDKSIKSLNKKQVTQILIHLIADKAISNYDAHLDNYGIDEKGHVIGIDKGDALKNFNLAVGGNVGKESSEFNLDQYGPLDVNFYKQVFNLVNQGILEVDFHDPSVVDAINRCKALSLDEVKSMCSDYAELRYPKNEERREKFYQGIYQRLQNMDKAFAEFERKMLEEYEHTSSVVQHEAEPEVELTKPKLVFDPSKLMAARDLYINARKDIPQEQPKPVEDEQLQAKIEELVKLKAIELPSHISIEIFIKYLKGEVPLAQFSKKSGKRENIREGVGRMGGEAHAQLMRELNKRLVQENQANILPEETKEQKLSSSIEDMEGAQMQENSSSSEEEALSLENLSAKLNAAANKGVIAINKPLKGKNGIINFMLDKTSLVEDRKLEGEFKKSVFAQLQAGQAIQDKEAFLKHVQKVKRIKDPLDEEVKPKASVKSEPHIEIVEEHESIDLPLPKRTPSKDKLEIVEEHETINLPMPKHKPKVSDIKHPTVIDTELEKENLPPQNKKPKALQFKSQSVGTLVKKNSHEDMWDSFQTSLSKINVAAEQGHITQNVHKRIVELVKTLNSKEKLNVKDKLNLLREKLLDIHESNLKNKALKALIHGFKEEYRKLLTVPSPKLKK